MTTTADPSRRTLLVAIGAVAVLALLAGIGIFMATRGDDAGVAQTGGATTLAPTTGPPTTQEVVTATTRRPRSTTTTSTTAPGPGDEGLPSPVTLPATGPPLNGGKLVVGLGTEGDNWNPTTSRFGADQLTAAQTVFDPLFAFDAEGAAQPYLAAGASANESLDVWDITVREGVTFHNGTPADAAAIAAHLEAAWKSPLSGAALRPVQNIEVTDARTVRVRLAGPWAVFPAALTGQIGLVAAGATLGERGATLPIGTGPFIFDQQTAGERLQVRRNANYWQKDASGNQLPYLDEIEFRLVADPKARGEALSEGDLDLALIPEGAAARSLVEFGDGFQYVVQPGNAEKTVVLLNTAAPPFDDADARRAVARATDTRAIAEALYGWGEAVDGIISHGSPWYHDRGPLGFDPEEARSSVGAYEARTGHPLEVTLSGPPSIEYQQIAQLLKTQWHEVGIDADLLIIQPTTHVVDVLKGDYEAAVFDGFGETDPDQMVQWLSSEYVGGPGDPSLNMSRLQDSEVDELLANGRRQSSREGRHASYAQLQERLDEVVPFVWVGSRRGTVVAGRSVRGLANAPLPSGAASLPYDNGTFRLTTTWLAR